MDNLAWVAIFRQIPEEKQNAFTLVTTGGVEIAIQSFLRIDVEFAVIKGRLSGSQDTGRVFFIAYDRIDYMGTMYAIKDTDYEELFGTLTIAAPVLVAPPVPVAPPAPVALPVMEPVLSNGHGATNGHNGTNGSNGTSGSDGPVASTGSGSRSSIRSEVLERFRNRSGPPSSPNLPNPRQG